MKTLYILLILLVSCGKSNLKFLKFNQKGKILHLLNYSIKDEGTLNNFVEELKLDKKYRKKLVCLLESNTEVKLDVNDIILRAASEDDFKIMKACYKYKKNFFDVKSIENKKLMLDTIDIVIKSRSFKCFKFLINIIKKRSTQMEYLDIEEIFDLFSMNSIENTYKYIDLKKEYLTIENTRSTITAIISPKPVIDLKILTSIGLGIGYIGMSLSKSCKNMSTRTMLLIGGTVLLTTPIYRYWQNLTRHKEDIVIKQKSIESITEKLNLKKYKLLKMKNEIEESELSMVSYLIDNLDINLNMYMIEKFEDAKKKKISNYLRNKLNNKKE